MVVALIAIFTYIHRSGKEHLLYLVKSAKPRTLMLRQIFIIKLRMQNSGHYNVHTADTNISITCYTSCFPYVVHYIR